MKDIHRHILHAGFKLLLTSSDAIVNNSIQDIASNRNL